jgi:hypothetical protein
MKHEAARRRPSGQDLEMAVFLKKLTKTDFGAIISIEPLPFLIKHSHPIRADVLSSITSAPPHRGSRTQTRRSTVCDSVYPTLHFANL